MKIKSANVHTLEEYFLLPKAEREWYGFYMRPYALEWDFMDDCKGWTAFYNKIRKEYPLQWFFREWLFSYENPIYRVFSNIRHSFWDLKYAVKNFINPNFPRWRNTLPRHKYADASSLIVEANFNLILDFYYGEVVDGCVDWQSDDKHSTFYNELKMNVEWIETGRKTHQEKIEEALSMSFKDKAKEDHNERYKMYDELNTQLEDRETAILKWMITNRGFFWS